MTAYTSELQAGNRLVRRYNIALLTIAATTCLCLLLMGAFTMWRVVQLTEDTRQQGVENGKRAQQVAELLRLQQHNEATRQQLIDDAVKKIAAEERRALAEHDATTKRYLSQIRGLSYVEVYGANNQETQRVVTRFVGPLPSGQPRPMVTVPPTCTKKNGRCQPGRKP